MRNPTEDDRQMLEGGLPYIRSILAFITWLRLPALEVPACYAKADEFIWQLKQDVGE
jgi:hypothetical protein